jgi:hypothetical protein
VDADRDGGIDRFVDQADDGFRDRLVVEEIDLGPGRSDSRAA